MICILFNQLDSHGGRVFTPPESAPFGVTRRGFFAPFLVARAILFIDGNNWYHGLKTLEITQQGRLDYG